MITFSLVSVAFTKTLIFVKVIETSENIINVLVINVLHGGGRNFSHQDLNNFQEALTGHDKRIG